MTGSNVLQADLACHAHFNVLQPAFFDLVEHGLHHLTRAGGDAAGAHADDDAVFLAAFTQGNLPLRFLF